MIGDIFQPTHLLFILGVALLVLGPKRLPEVGRSLGKSMSAFRGAMAGIEDQTKDVFNFDEPEAAPSTPAAETTTTPVQPEETVLVNTATVPVAAPAAEAVATPATVVEPDPADYAD